MISRLAAAILVFGLALGAVAACAATASANLADGRTLVLSAGTIDTLGGNWGKLALTGSANVKLFDKPKNTMLHASAGKIVVTLASDVGAKAPSKQVIKSAELVGSPKVVYEAPDAATGKIVRTTAAGAYATYDGSTETVFLKGNVKITNENPALFEGPAEMTGDEATVRLGANLGPDDVRFSISSSPGASTITATPKAKESSK